jgi:hypothetical protein
MYATTEDERIIPYTSSIPNLNIGENKYIINGGSHDYLHNRVLEYEINTFCKWIKYCERIHSL